MASVTQKLFPGSALRVLNLGAGALVGLALLPLMVYSLGDRKYGLWALVGTLTGYYGVMDFGLSTAVTRHLAGAGCIRARLQAKMPEVLESAYRAGAMLRSLLGAPAAEPVAEHGRA